MESRVDSQDPIQEEVWQLLERLRVVARTVKLSNAALARRARVPIASLVRYFHGQGEPKLQFLLAVVRACGLEVREFFELAYPELEAPTAARLKLDYSLGPLRPVKRLPSPPLEDGPKPVTREDVEQMMVQLQRRCGHSGRRNRGRSPLPPSCQIHLRKMATAEVTGKTHPSASLADRRLLPYSSRSSISFRRRYRTVFCSKVNDPR